MVEVSFARRAGGWIFILVTAYLIFCVSLSVVQKKLMYFPDTTKFVPSEWALKELTPITVKTSDGLDITSWFVLPREEDRVTVVFFQGNNGHLGYRNYKVRPWIDAGYGVLMVGYRGFGNEGSPSEKGFYEDARSVIAGLHTKGVAYASMVFYGEALGAGVAVQMATEFKAAGLILEAPLTSVAEVAAEKYPLVPVRLLATDKYNSLGKIKDVHMPLLVLHGKADDVVPVKYGVELLNAANEPKRGEFINGAGHFDVYNFRVQHIVLSFLGRLNDAFSVEAKKEKDAMDKESQAPADKKDALP